jgi:hypothetical protein
MWHAQFRLIKMKNENNEANKACDKEISHWGEHTSHVTLLAPKF